jgi:hypothetical protein
MTNQKMIGECGSPEGGGKVITASIAFQMLGLSVLDAMLAQAVWWFIFDRSTS